MRIRKGQSNQGASPLEQKVSSGTPTPNQNTMSSTKPLLSSCSPRDIDERDPDVIPAKYGKCITHNPLLGEIIHALENLIRE